MKSEIFERIRKETSLEIRFKVDNEMFLIDFLCEMGYRPDRAWTDEERETLDKILAYDKKMTNYHLETVKKWKEDGEPT